MAKLKFFVSLILFLSLACFIGCKKNEANSVLFLKIINNTSSTIAVTSTPNGSHKDFKGEEITTDYGTIVSGETSTYHQVSNAFLINISNTVFSNSVGPIKFVISNPPSTQWSLKITSVNGGYSLQPD